MADALIICPFLYEAINIPLLIVLLMDVDCNYTNGLIQACITSLNKAHQVKTRYLQI